MFDVECLMNGKREVVHARRLIWYRADREGANVSQSLLEYANHSETTYQDVAQLLDIHKGPTQIEVLVE